MDHGLNTALVKAMSEDIVKKLDAKETAYKELAVKAEDNNILKLSHISSSMAISEAKVIVLEIAKDYMTMEHNVLLKELNKRIEEALAKS